MAAGTDPGSATSSTYGPRWRHCGPEDQVISHLSRLERLFGACAIVVMSAGCLGKTATKPFVCNCPPYTPQDSPANCLSNLQRAYVDRDLDAYRALFSTDFTFVFSPADSASPTEPTPPRWGLADEIVSADHMFHSELIDKIDLVFIQDTAVDSDSLYAGTSKVSLTQVGLLVYTRMNGTPYIYRVADGTATFYLKEYPDEHASNGKPLWRIWRWEDQLVSRRPGISLGTCVRNMSWGQIKDLYRK